jgi:putative aldouronate transport system substrate-binding protein
MLKIKRLIAVVLAMMFVFSLTACKAGDSTKETSDQPDTEAASSSDSSEGTESDTSTADTSKEIVTLNVAMLSGTEVSGAEDVEAKANELLAQYGVAINLTFINFGSWTQQTNLLLTGGSDSVDVLPLFGTPLTTYVNNGQVLALDDLLENQGKDIKNVFTQEQLDAGKVKGKLYGITTSRDLAASYGVCMRKDLLDETGIDISTITDLASLEPVLAKVHELHPEIYSLFGSSTGPVEAWGWDRLGDGNALGVIMDRGQGDTIVNLYEQPEYEAFVRTMRDWYEKGYMMQDALSNTETQQTLTKAGKLFCYFNNMKPGFAEQETRSTGFEMVTAEMIPAYSTTTNVQGLTWGIAASCTNPEAAMTLLDQMYTNTELSNLLVNGIEGVNYTYTDDTKTLIDFPEGIDGSNTNYANMGWAWPNQFITPVWVPNTANYWEDLKTFNQTATPSKAMGFSPDTTNITDEITACTNVVSKYNAALMTGSVDVDEALPKFLQELKDSGIDKIVTEKQAQFDTWKAE